MLIRVYLSDCQLVLNIGVRVEKRDSNFHFIGRLEEMRL